MTIDNNLQILDMDSQKSIHKDALKLCTKLGAILDVATSDVCLFVYAKNKRDANKIAQVYGVNKATFEGQGLNGILPHLRWYCIG